MIENWEKTEEELGRRYVRDDFPDLAKFETGRGEIPVDLAHLTPRVRRQWLVWSNWADREWANAPPPARDENGHDEEEAAYWARREKYRYDDDD